MKKQLIIFSIMLLTSGLWAQNKSGAVKTVSVSQAIQQNNYNIQVGLPYLGENENTASRTTSPIDLRFPWDVLYLYKTFAEESFDVSKGYFGDKILITWTIRNNLNSIDYITISRREYNDTSENSWNPISNVSPSNTEYEDKYVEGGVLYEYKLEAVGVSPIEELYNTYITGIGYRSPTAIITGNVNFKGGNPVKDVTIRAESDGSTINIGNALHVPATGSLEIRNINKQITTKATLQAWMRPEVSFVDDSQPSIRIFRIENGPNNIDVDVNLRASSNKLEVNIGGSIYQLHNYYPSGNLNSRGDDILVPVAKFNNNFIHYSIALNDGNAPVLYINGREINQSYKEGTHAKLVNVDPNYTTPHFDVTIPTQTNILSIGGTATNWSNLHIGSGNNAYIDEIRIWNAVKDAAKIKTDYRRYIGGNDASLISYLRANEGVGQFAYDLSRTGFNYNKNHGKLWDSATDPDKVLWITGSGNIPSADQLGILGVTDTNGNYEITAIPYSGTGESFTITPLLGVHQFEPAQQLVFLGQGSEVVNKIDFIDKSSFIFKGRVLADTRGVFQSFVEIDGSGLEGDTMISGPDILDEGYNYYEKSGEKFPKGEYWYNTEEVRLERYARIPMEGINVYIDGDIVLDENNIPVVSDDEGIFNISVPIGNHYISLKKQGHEFTYNGRFPAEDGTFKEFFEDAEETVNFVDNTRVALVGRVVGGSVESQKVIGFGQDGLVTTTETDANEIEETITISSINNIGVASMTLDYTPIGGNITPYTKFNYTTNPDSGEYRVEVMPLNYSISQLTGLKILTNDAISLLDADETVNMVVVNTTTIPEYEKTDSEIIEGEPYHYVKSFTYRSIPVLRVTNQESDEEIEIEDVAYKTEGMKYPIYTQFEYYQILLDRYERYTNYDEGNPGIEFLVPVTDGELEVTNNLALADSETIEVNANDASKLTYTFRGGLPTISSPFTKTIDIKYRINRVDYPAENYSNEGIVLGGQSDGSQTFITAAPDVPDIILRDPPGSNSFASIEEGESFTFTSQGETTSAQENGIKHKFKSGIMFTVGGGLAGPVVETDTKSDSEVGIKLTTSSKFGRSTTRTYSFTQKISTSDDPRFVGADGDLYIGNSKNYFYGSYDDVQVSNTIPENENITLTNTAGESVFISIQKAMYFVQEPSETFFVFSQKYILESLIPELQLIVDNYDNPTDDGVPPPLTKEDYEQQIDLWRETILKNERMKYRAFKDRAPLKSEILGKINSYIGKLEDKISSSSEDFNKKYQLSEKIENSERIKALVNDVFADNISFDAGVGEFSRSSQTSIVRKTSTEFTLKLESSFSLAMGLTVNGAGLEFETAGSIGQEFKAAFSAENTKSTNISYTLKDNDSDNLFSVDVVNTFGIDGPIFNTIGGKSSCPYEGSELSYFYNHSTYDPLNRNIIELPENQREELSAATQRVEVPLISTEVADLSNVLEGNNAEYTLILENNSVTETDADFLLKVDNLSNPNNALINIEPNGTLVSVPYGEKVFYTMTLGKSISDVYDYENIRVVLQSTCDGEAVSDDVLVSAHFIPSCTEVVIDAPLENWVYNMDVAYNQDGSTNPLPIKLIGFNRTFNSFQKIDLEYRLATSSTWTRLHTYYNTQSFYDEAINTGADANTITLIDSPTLNFPFDIADRKLQDGNYEIRARSTCTNDTDFISEPILGRVDLHAPQRFGTPLPTDGILSSGEELKVSFNENIFYNSAVSNIEIKGETNQLPIDHNVSLYFEGTANNAIIEKAGITSGDFTIEFWMNNSTTAPNAMILEQADGLKIGLNNGELYFTLGGITTQGLIANDNLYHHYTLTHNNGTGEISIYQDDAEIAGVNGGANLQFTNNNDLVIGGNSFVGNMHDLRLWRKTISLSTAYANMYDKLIGNEKSLIGYWPMTEGRGEIAKDLARFKHAKVNASWDIKPKGNSYELLDTQYLTLDNTALVQLTSEMDATISFWVKTGVSQNATIFSNGRGDGTDIVQTNGLANKWAINISTAGLLSFESEGASYPLTSQSVADNSWHHVALLLNRQGSLRTYIDAEQVSSNSMSAIGGFSGNKVWLGARGHIDLAAIETVENTFTGKIDEFRLWNTLRNEEQIDRDRFNEVDFESIGLMLYAKMNEQDPPTSNGPRYYHAEIPSNTVLSSNAVLSSGAVNYSNDTPAIKIARNLIKFQVNHIINEDDMILEPAINDWASLEGQILDITVHRMFDDANNMQESPITWTAYVNKNDVSWFVDGYNEVVDIVKNINEERSFEITIINKGGSNQPYTISGIPNWLSLSSKSGKISPNRKVVIVASIDSNLSAGAYLENLYLETDFGFDEKLQIDLKVLTEEPEWVINPKDFDYSMTIIGRIKVDGVFSDDSYDKIAAFYNGEVRGVTNLIFDENYQQHYAYLTIYSNVPGQEIEFRIWDATQGKILQATMDQNLSIPFVENDSHGSLITPAIFNNTFNIQQDLKMHNGWTWVTFNVNDLDFSNLNLLTQDLKLETNDRILSHAPSRLETYYFDITKPKKSTWSGTISAFGGLSNLKMYKVNLAHGQTFTINGMAVDIATWEFPIAVNWNWLPYTLSRNIQVSEALALFDASDGDLIKSQNLFAIYDPTNGWSGTLNYLEEGHGYMLKSGREQAFKYPTIFGKMATNSSKHEVTSNKEQGKIEAQFTKYPENMNAVVLLPEGYDELFVYDLRGILKGKAKNQRIGEKHLSFITIYGNEPEELIFYIGNGISQKRTSKSFVFTGDKILGTVGNPVLLEGVILEGLKIYPNPFTNDLTIQLLSKEETLMGIKLYNVLGQFVYGNDSMLKVGENSINITPGIPKGVYFLHLNVNSAISIYKVIKN